MEIINFFYLLVLPLAVSKCRSIGAADLPQDIRISTITRHNNGDLFVAESDTCNADTCIGVSSGTAKKSEESALQGSCSCQCHSHLPAFREDLQICVDDIHECVLSPFVSGSMVQQIPFVFLPLKGQIIHPSKEISFAAIQTPVCAVSGAKFLTDGGWIDLRNSVDADVPFRLFRDEGRTFLQWVGDPDLRTRMGGRLVLVHLMCREIANNDAPSEIPVVYTPCVAFRVVGTPTKYLSNVSEVIFSPDAQGSENLNSNGLSISEYVAIGICSILLGLIYVASVFLYLHLRRKRRDTDKEIERRQNQTLAAGEEGVIKNNPLLNLGRHFSGPETSFSDSCSSDTDVTPDIIQHHDDRKKSIQITSALIHQQQKYDHAINLLPQVQPLHQESIERLPEENVSIVETLESREDRPDSLKVIGTTRRKLYFNPAYFDPQLLIAPPPAAIEFLSKIREVISIAKQKMASKKFTPILNGIPEEDSNYLVDIGSEYSKDLNSRRGSLISLKRENSRRKTCSGCPGCEPQDFKSLSGKLPEFPSLAACQNCSLDSKQISIRKWLENVPTLKSPQSSGDELSTNHDSSIKSQNQSPKRIRSPARSYSPEHITPNIKKNNRPRSPAIYEHTSSSIKSGSSSHSKGTVRTNRSVKSQIKGRAPPPPLPLNPPKIIKQQNIYETLTERKVTLPPPDMINEAIAIESKNEEPKIPTITKKKMNAVINELTKLDHLKINASPNLDRQSPEYDTDSLERSKENKTNSIDYAEISSSQPSPSLSSALPLDEEMMMRNAILNTKTGNRTISKLNMQDVLKPEEHDYELIILKKNNGNIPIFKLPELLQRGNGYSLVSEVYVNNGYNYGSAPSTPSESNCSTLERAPKIIYEENKPGHLLIEVEDCPDNYIKAEDSDNFEPDTLDRKPKIKFFKTLNENEFIDSLERPNQILLKTTGSFKKDSVVDCLNQPQSNFNRNFSSLREIYEAKTKTSQGKEESLPWNINLCEIDFEGRILTLEERHCRRQRKSPNAVPPDVIPPNPTEINSPIYEHPKPPRKVNIKNIPKPPLPPKETKKDFSNKKPLSQQENNNKSDISILQNFIHTDDILFKNGINNQFILQAATITTNPINLTKQDGGVKKSWKKIIKINPKIEDPGYLSTDSNESNKKKKENEHNNPGSETDESLGDGHSESGAESIETHSVFFGSFRKSSCMAGSVDSGVGSELKTLNNLEENSDSEMVMYNTKVPFKNKKK